MMFRRLVPGQMPSAAEWNLLCDWVERLSNISGDAASGIEIVRSGGAPPSIRLIPTTVAPPTPPPPGGTLPIARVLGPYTTLTTGVGSTDLSLTVQQNLPFPNSSFFALIDNEMISVTGAGTPTWSITRAQLGTGATGHANGSLVQQATYLTSAISAGATTLTVNDGTLFPTAAASIPYFIQIGSEVLQVTHQTGLTTLTVARGQFGTAAASHSVNAAVVIWVKGSDPSTLLNFRQAVLTTFNASLNQWTDGATVILAPAENQNPQDPYYTPLQSNQRYFCQQNGTVRSVAFYQTWTPWLSVSGVNPGTGDTVAALASANAINVDQASGLTLSDPYILPFVGVQGVLIGAHDASPTHSGVVNLIHGQQLAGSKVLVPSPPPAVGTAPLFEAWDGVAGTNRIKLGFLVGAPASGGVEFNYNGAVSQLSADTQVYYASPANGNNCEFRLLNHSGGAADSFYSVTDAGGTVRSGLSTVIGYNKSAGGTGTLTFVGGILTGST